MSLENIFLHSVLIKFFYYGMVFKLFFVMKENWMEQSFLVRHCHHIILFEKTLKDVFGIKFPGKYIYIRVFISILTFPKNNPTRFCFRCHRFSFISYAYVQIYMMHKVIISNQYRNVTTYINIAVT